MCYRRVTRRKQGEAVVANVMVITLLVTVHVTGAGSNYARCKSVWVTCGEQRRGVALRRNVSLKSALNNCRAGVSRPAAASAVVRACAPRRQDADSKVSQMESK